MKRHSRLHALSLPALPARRNFETAFELFRLLFVFSMMFLLSAHAVTALLVNVEVSLPATLIEDESATATLHIETDAQFSGSVSLGGTNVNLPATNVAFTTADFTPLAAGFRATKQVPFTPSSPGSLTFRADVLNQTGTLLATTTLSQTVASGAPIISSASPSGTIVAKNAVLRVITDEPATCSYFSSNASTTAFSITGSTIHESVLNSLSEKSYLFDVVCTDRQGHTNSPYPINFIIDYPPSAKIELSRSSPLHKGLVEVELTASEELSSAPTLDYSFDTNPDSLQSIALTGSGKSWQGFMIIDNSNEDLVGSFTFRGTDLKGHVGTTITEGNLFLVDTIAPPAPSQVRAVQTSSGAVKLDWTYSGEGVSSFTVFRSTSSGVGELDLLEKTSNQTSFTDIAVTNQVTYYYRVRATDLAGNLGALSNEIFITVERGAEASTTTPSPAQKTEPKVLPPALVPLVDEVITRAESLKLDIEEAELIFENANEAQRSLMNDLDYSTRFTNAQRTITRILSALDTLKNQYATENDLRASLKIHSDEIAMLREETPRTLSISSSSDFIIEISSDNVQTAIGALGSQLGLSDDEKRTFLRKNIRLQDTIRVTGTLTHFTEFGLNGDSTISSMIQKTISSQQPDPLEDVLVVELIPTQIADPSSLKIITPNFEMLSDSNSIKWSFPQVSFNGQKIKYLFPKDINEEEARSLLSVVLLSPYQLEQIEASSATGLAVFDTVTSALNIGETGTAFVKGSLLLLFVLTIYYFFGEQASMLKERLEKIKKVLPFRSSKHPDKDKKIRDDLNTLINACYLWVLRNNQQQAKEQYKKIMSHYKVLSPGLRREIYADCVELQKKIQNMDRKS